MNFWPFGRKKEKEIWKTGPVPTNLNKHQLSCVSSAKWNYNEMRRAIERKSEFPTQRVECCFWYIVLTHFESFTDVYGGYSLDLTIPRVIANTHSAMKPVLLPKLEEIIRCEDAELKALLTYQYVYILMAAVFDPSGGMINHAVLVEVLDTKMLVYPPDILEKRREFLEPLGFKSYNFEECGEQHTTWYWPSP